MDPGRMDTDLGCGLLEEASRARRASVFWLAAPAMVARMLTIFPSEEGTTPLTGTATPLPEGSVGRREKGDFPVAGTKATLVPGFISSGEPEKRSFWPAETMTGAPPEVAAETAMAVATWGLGRMERRPGAFWECWATTITMGCSSCGWGSSTSAPVFCFLAAAGGKGAENQHGQAGRQHQQKPLQSLPVRAFI